MARSRRAIAIRLAPPACARVLGIVVGPAAASPLPAARFLADFDLFFARRLGLDGPKKLDGGHGADLSAGRPQRLVVGQFAAEQGVDEVEHGGLAAEIQGQRQLPRGGNLPAKLPEDVGIGPAKTIDRLLEIADEKQLPVRVPPVDRALTNSTWSGSVSWNSSTSRSRVWAARRFRSSAAVRSAEEVAGGDQQVVEVHRRQFPLAAFVGGGDALGDGQAAARRFPPAGSAAAADQRPTAAGPP